MDRLEQLSRDDLVKEITKLNKIFKIKKLNPLPKNDENGKKLGKSALLNIFRKNDNYLHLEETSNSNSKTKKSSKRSDNRSLADIFPFEESIFLSKSRS